MAGAGPSQKPGRGALLQLLSAIGALVLLVAISLAAAFADASSQASQVVAAILIAVGGAGAVVALRLLWRHGARHRAANAAEVMQRDGRPPVLYLRSFAGEKSVSEEEETLARIIGEIGPFVAIGSPGDPLPPLGAWRFYERHFEKEGRNWQIFVRELLSRAALVFMVPAPTVGLGWEIAQCRELLRPQQLMILVQADRATFERFRQMAAVARLQLPDFPEEHCSGRKKDEFVGAVRFRPDWSSYFHPFPGPPLIETVVDNRERRLRTGLRPALADQGLALRAEFSQGPLLRGAMWCLIAALTILTAAWFSR